MKTRPVELISGYDLTRLLEDARSRWLKPDQLLFILQNHHPSMIRQTVPQKPPSGSLFLFNKRNVYSFRKDGHEWILRANRNTVKEAHENLKVDNTDVLTCYYAYGAVNPNLRRRVYWMLENKDIVLVHYLDIGESKDQSDTITPSAQTEGTSSSSDMHRSCSVEVDKASENLEECLGKNNISESYPGQAQMPGGVDPSATQMPDQKFIISRISPDWCFSDEITEVIVVGTFRCDPSVTIWAAFGNIQVPAQILQDGVICCQAPPMCPGKVSFWIFSGNWECCSEGKEFEYRDRNSSKYFKLQQQQDMEEGRLLVELVGMLLSTSSRMQYKHCVDYDAEALLRGCGNSSGITDRVMQEVLKEKLQQWLAVWVQEADKDSSCILSKKERGIIHLVAGLGYEWALNLILDVGVGVNFRDTKGWTALHWAARFGREEMVGALVARGASVSAVTDPTAQDPMGKNAASVADEYGHTGLAAYLSTSALTSRMSSLGINEAELEVEVEVSNTQNGFSASDEDEILMKQVLEANEKVSKAAQLIQTAFRVHSDRRKQQRVSAAAFSRPKNFNAAVVTIQKCYRSWKCRTHFLRVRKKVVKIQAYVRGRQVRKYYHMIQVVSIMEKIMIRWWLKRRGLRGFKIPREAMDEEDEDILKDFAKKKLDTTVNEALERIRKLKSCRQGRGQYSRMLHLFRVAKSKLEESTSEDAMNLLNGVEFGDNDNDTVDVDMLQDEPPSSPDCFRLLRSELR